MILKAKHHFLLYPFFKWYAQYRMKKHHSTIRISGEFTDRKFPVLLIANHISWWDGFWAVYVNEQLLHRKFHFMMLEEQLKKHWYFQYTGGFSVRKHSRTVVESLRYAAELLSDPQNMVLLFPQGEIQSMHQQDIHFESGLEQILKNKEKKVQVLMMASLPDYFSEPRPGITFYLREYKGERFDKQSIEQQYAAFYANAVQQQLKTTNKG